MSAVIQQSPLPSRHAVRVLVEDLVGRPVDLVDAEPMPASPNNFTAVYVTDRLHVSAIVMVDFPLAARLGAALGMLPKPAVEDAIKDVELPEMMHDCCYEVLNVLASVFNVPNAPHVRLYKLHGPGEPVSADIATRAGLPGVRLDVRLSIAGYGDGRMAVVVH